MTSFAIIKKLIKLETVLDRLKMSMGRFAIAVCRDLSDDVYFYLSFLPLSRGYFNRLFNKLTLSR